MKLSLKTDQPGSRPFSAEQAESERVRSLAISLAPGTEALLASDDLSVVRRIISETAMNQSLTRCRILLPDGQVDETGHLAVAIQDGHPLLEATDQQHPPIHLDQVAA